MSPAKRRAAVEYVQRSCGVSQRRACEVLNQSRSSQRYQPVVSDDEAPLVKRMLELVAEFPRFGYRQIGRLIRHEGFPVNIKRIYRLWLREGLKARTWNQPVVAGRHLLVRNDREAVFFELPCLDDNPGKPSSNEPRSDDPAPK